jgi:hypothetical protein
MFANRTRVLLIVSQDVLDRARVVAGKATTALKLPVSLQIVLRALIEEGLERPDDPSLLRNVERQAEAVRHIRTASRRGGRDGSEDGNRASGIWPQPRSRQQQRGGSREGHRGDPETRRGGTNGTPRHTRDGGDR